MNRRMLILVFIFITTNFILYLNSYFFLDEPTQKLKLNADFLFINSAQKTEVSPNIDDKKNEHSNSSSIDIQISSCFYPHFSYTDEELKKFWNFEDFPECKSKSEDNILVENNKFSVRCASGVKPEFLSYRDKPERLGGNKKLPTVWEEFSPDPRQISFAFIRCGSENIHSFTILNENLKVSETMKSKRLSLMTSLNLNKTSSSNFNVLLLTLDSVSRGSAYRNLKKVVSYLKNLKNAESFELLNPAVPECHTIDNMAQVLYGQSIQKMQTVIGTRPPTMASRLHLEYQKHAIWRHFSEMGFVTLFLHDTVWNFINTFTGYEILADHVFVNYWKAVWAVYGFTDYSQGQKCIGDQNRHNIGLGYTREFFQKYPENHKFAYVHLNAAHENEGNVKTVDQDLLVFLRSIITSFNQKNEEFVVFLIADHGQRRNSMQFDFRNSFEAKQAMSFIITSQNFSKDPVRSVLSYNSQCLFSRFDLNLSLKDLSFYPFEGISSKTYEKFKSQYEVQDVVSLFREKIRLDRTCKDIKVPAEMCPCSSFVDVSHEELDLSLFHKGFVSMIFEYFLQTAKENFKCFTVDKVELKEMQKLVMFLKHDGWDVIYHVQVKLQVDNEVKNATVEIRGCTEERIEKTKNVLPGKKFSILKYNYFGTKMFYQIFKVRVSESCECFCSELHSNKIF